MCAVHVFVLKAQDLQRQDCHIDDCDNELNATSSMILMEDVMPPSTKMQQFLGVQRQGIMQV